MQLNCQACRAKIPAEEINLDRMMAKCRANNWVFSFAADFADIYGFEGSMRIDVPLPMGIAVDNFGGEFKITRRWFSPKIIKSDQALFLEQEIEPFSGITERPLQDELGR